MATKAERDALRQAEQAALNAAHAARVARALRWSDQPTPEPDLAPPEWDSEHKLSIGYTYLAGGDPRVVRACSSTTAHALGRTDKTTSQGPLALYSTRVLALRALRAQLEMRYAEQLAHIDWEIAGEYAEIALEAAEYAAEQA